MKQGLYQLTLHFLSVGYVICKTRLSLLLRYVNVKRTPNNFRIMFIGNGSYKQSRMEGNIRKYAGGGILVTGGRYEGLVTVAAVNA